MKTITFDQKCRIVEAYNNGLDYTDFAQAVSHILAVSMAELEGKIYDYVMDNVNDWAIYDPIKQFASGQSVNQ